MDNPYQPPESPSGWPEPDAIRPKGGPVDPDALDRARAKAYRRLIPILFFSYMIAYVDRTNGSIAKLTMVRDLPWLTDRVFGIGSGIFFLGYFLLEVPGTLIVERWSARRWICRIMVTWGIVAALTAGVRAEWHFYTARFLLGLAEAGFYPGVIVYLTHWFPKRDRARALAYFFVATPIAQAVSPKLSYILLKFGTVETIRGATVQHPALWGLQGWQWVYIAWGIPAVILGLIVLLMLTDHPREARWLDPDERAALEAELAREKAANPGHGRFPWEHLPTVLILALAYFGVVVGNYGVEFFMPSILESWYHLKLDDLTWLVVIPPLGSLLGQLGVGWSSDHRDERRFHTIGPIYLGAAALGLMAFLGEAPLWATVGLFFLALTGLKAYLPAFWALPYLILSESAAAASIGFINSVGNLGGFFGPWLLGSLKTSTGSYRIGLTVLATSIAVSGTIILALGIGRTRAKGPDREA